MPVLLPSMDKLDEREPATRNPLVAAPALAVQFFLIPLVVVGIAVLLYSGGYWLLSAKNRFKGPKVQGTAAELAKIEAELGGALVQ